MTAADQAHERVGGEAARAAASWQGLQAMQASCLQASWNSISNFFSSHYKICLEAEGVTSQGVHVCVEYVWCRL